MIILKKSEWCRRDVSHFSVVLVVNSENCRLQ